ncbi:mRNA surveillance protein pelota [Candidatus Woesearchaeota archaeon]|nr:mRNA surveillance protein pelota [Candidatus Woesearchaeota archaeon]
MKIIYSDLKNNELKLKVENDDDVYTLHSVIVPGDVVKGVCERKIKVGSGERAKSIKKTFTAEILVDKTTFDKNVFELRINGKTLQESEDVPKGSFQTIEVSQGAVITIKKEKWMGYHLKKVKDACVDSKSKVIIVLADRETAIFALMKKSGYEILTEMHGEVAKKAVEIKKVGDFFGELVKQIQEYVKRFNVTNVVVASPAFWKEEIVKKITDSSLKQKIVTAACNSVSENGINEVLKSDELKNLLKQERAAMENVLVEKVLKEISKNGAVAYGESEVISAVEQSNVQTLLFTDKFFLKKSGQEAEYFDSLVQKCEQKKAEIHIISSEHDGGKKLEGLGGIAALLRYKSYS